MISWIKNNLHGLNSFIRYGWREPTTIIAILGLFLWYFYDDILYQIGNVIRSSQLTSTIVNNIELILMAILIFLKGKK